MSKILCSGSSGFIGSHLLKALDERGDDVIPIPRETVINTKLLEELLKREKPDIIYHLASYGNHYFQADPPITVITNFFGLWNMLWESKDIDYKKFINFSTSSVTLPRQTFYSASKASGEHIAEAFSQQYKKPILTVRPYSIYGEGEQEFRFIPTVIKALLFGDTIDLDTTATHDWVYVGDFVNTLIGLDKTGIVNLGTGYSHSNLEIVRKLEAISRKKLNFVEKKMRDYDSKDWVCPEKSVVSDIDEGLAQTFAYYAKKFTSN